MKRGGFVELPRFFALLHFLPRENARDAIAS